MNINTWASAENSSANIIGKKVLCFPDVRLKPAKQYGQVWDAGGLDQKSVGMLLMIIGGDKLPIGIKYDKLKWEGRITGKVIFITNEIPNLNDPTGALGERLTGVNFPRNFEEEGKKDPDLLEKLRPELPGIANRLMAGYRRLMKRGRFIEPASGAIIKAKINAKTTPVLTFFNAYFEFDAGSRVPTWVFSPAWKFWCGKMGQFRLLESISTPSLLSRQLSQNVEGWTGEDFRPHGGDRCFLGIRLKPDADLARCLAAFAKEKGKEFP